MIYLREGDVLTVELPNGKRLEFKYVPEGENEDYPNLPEIEIHLPRGDDGQGFTMSDCTYRFPVAK
jgi:hypothetical protein